MYKPFLEEYEATKLLRLSSNANRRVEVLQVYTFSYFGARIEVEPTKLDFGFIIFSNNCFLIEVEFILDKNQYNHWMI